MPGITLKRCPKVYMRETHRSMAPASTLELIQRVQEVVGIREIVEIADQARTGIPAFMCKRLRPDGSKATHTGKGHSHTQDRVSLIMEAIERYSSEYREEAVFHALCELIERDPWSIAKFRNAPDNAILVEDIPENGFLLERIRARP